MKTETLYDPSGSGYERVEQHQVHDSNPFRFPEILGYRIGSCLNDCSCSGDSDFR